MLEVNHIDVFHEDTPVVRQLSLLLGDDTIGCLLGASGCGKTTLLRAVAGLHPIRKGSISIAGKRCADAHFSLPAEQRNVGMMFQDLALFPHLTVIQNVQFGLSRQPAPLRQSRTAEILDLVEIPQLQRKKYPHELSGGQQQRVALARALAPKPDLLLLDEPFSSLDLELREQLAVQVRTILKHEKVAAMMVTHDQLEAFAIADIIGVMQNGEIAQWDSAYNLYHKPITRYVADFVGLGSFIPVTVVDAHSVQSDFGVIRGTVSADFRPGEQVDLLVRPDDIPHDDASPIQAKVEEKRFLGAEFLYKLRLPGGHQALCYAPSHHDHTLGQPIGIRLELEHLILFKR